MKTFSPRAIDTLSAAGIVAESPSQPIMVLVQPLFDRDPLLVKMTYDHIPAPGLEFTDDLTPDWLYRYDAVHRVSETCYQVTASIVEDDEDELDISFG